MSGFLGNTLEYKNTRASGARTSGNIPRPRGTKSILDPSSLEDKNLGEQPEARLAGRDDPSSLVIVGFDPTIHS